LSLASGADAAVHLLTRSTCMSTEDIQSRHGPILVTALGPLNSLNIWYLTLEVVSLFI